MYIVNVYNYKQPFYVKRKRKINDKLKQRMFQDVGKRASTRNSFMDICRSWG